MSVFEKINILTKAFTLAEVLIVLGIIGLIADMTVPTLVGNYRTQSAQTKIKKFYTSMSQAMLLAESENGPSDTWDFPLEQNSTDMRDYFNKYLAKYFNILRIEDRQYYLAYSGPQEGQEGNNALWVNLSDGSGFYMKSGVCIDISLDINGDKKPNQVGRDQFAFIMCPNTSGTGGKKNLRSYWQMGADINDRGTLLKYCEENPVNCTRLIEFDGWMIKDDYPHKI